MKALEELETSFFRHREMEPSFMWNLCEIYLFSIL